jgi:hypothetical protein
MVLLRGSQMRPEIRPSGQPSVSQRQVLSRSVCWYRQRSRLRSEDIALAIDGDGEGDLLAWLHRLGIGCNLDQESLHELAVPEVPLGDIGIREHHQIGAACGRCLQPATLQLFTDGVVSRWQVLELV